MTETGMMMGRTGKMTVDGLLRSLKCITSEGCGNYLSASADGMQDLVRDCLDKTIAIKSDRNLNAQGRSDRLGDMLEAHAANVDAIAESEIAEGYAKRSKFIESSIGNPFAKFRGGDIPGASETRALLYKELEKDGGDLAVANMLRNAAGKGDVKMLAAAADAPEPFPVCTDEVMAECEATYRRTLHPKETTEQAELDELASALQFNATGAKEAVRKLSMVSPDNLRFMKKQSFV